MENPYPQVLSAPTPFPASHTNMQDLFYNSTKACACIRVHVCCERLKLGQVGGGGQSSATTCQLFVVPRNKMRKEEKEGDRYFLDTVSRNVQAAGDGRCIRLSLFLECCFYSANILTVFPPNSPP